MPTYEYKCTNGHLFEVVQRMSDDTLTACQTCGATVQRVFHPIAVHFKGSGFYNTDYGTRRRSREAAEASDSNGSDGGSKTESTKAESTTAESTKSGSAKSDSATSDSGKTGSSTSTAAATE
jgi:putative FmdB family regulatory protein